MKSILLWFSNHTLVLFALLIFITIVFWLLRFQKKLKLTLKMAVLISALHVIIGWSCMRLLAIIEVGGDLERAANLRLYGAVFVLPVLYYLFAKKTGRNTALMMDVASICVIFGVLMGRLNCLTSGCCQGVLIFGSETLRWPIRELELLFYIVFIAVYSGKILKQKTHGEVYAVYLIAYGTLRFVFEFVREEFTTQIGVFHLAHIWSLLAIAAGAVMYHQVSQNVKPGAARRKKNKQIKKEEINK